MRGLICASSWWPSNGGVAVKVMDALSNVSNTSAGLGSDASAFTTTRRAGRTVTEIRMREQAYPDLKDVASGAFDSDMSVLDGCPLNQQNAIWTSRGNRLIASI